MKKQPLSVGLILILVSFAGAYILYHSLGRVGPAPTDLHGFWATLPVSSRMIFVGLFIAFVYGLGVVVNELLGGQKR